MNRPVVIKVGGSLLDWPDLPKWLPFYLEARSEERLVLVVGGGRFADALRDLDAVHSLGESRSHELALRVLDLTARVFAELSSRLVVVERLEDLPDAWMSGLVPVLAPRQFLEDDDLLPDPLPHTWAATTDSIAARLAVRVGAFELVLFKSAPAPPVCTRIQAARLGLVDSEFPRASLRVPVVNYRVLRQKSHDTRLE